ncbi:MAG: hypothetical protein EXR98_23000 [Gemmataceae bacterium]|nr:hypothetical protein [Gemmataceae bacterium]
MIVADGNDVDTLGDRERILDFLGLVFKLGLELLELGLRRSDFLGLGDLLRLQFAAQLISLDAGFKQISGIPRMRLRLP